MTVGIDKRKIFCIIFVYKPLNMQSNVEVMTPKERKIVL